MDSDADADASKLTFGALSQPLLNSTLNQSVDSDDLVSCLSTASVYQLLKRTKEDRQSRQEDGNEVFDKMLKYSKKFGAGFAGVPFAASGTDNGVIEGLDNLAEYLYSLTFAMPNPPLPDSAPAAFRALPNKLHSFEVVQIINLTLHLTTGDELVSLIPSLERIGVLQLEDMLEKVKKAMRKLVEG